jgi:hypothetical protein
MAQANPFRSQILNQRPMEILNYAIKHDYPDIIDQVAPISICRPSPLTEAADMLTHPGALRVWVRTYICTTEHALKCPVDKVLCTMG